MTYVHNMFHICPNKLDNKEIMDNQDFFGVFIYKIIITLKTWIFRKGD